MAIDPFNMLALSIRVDEESYAGESFVDQQEVDDPFKSILDHLRPSGDHTQPESPELKSDYAKSAPFPTAFKGEVNTKKGIVTAYLTTYKDMDGADYVDPYNDVIHDTAFHSTLAQLEAQRKRKNNPWLVPDLWQHDKHTIIGGIKGITLDRHGPIYEAYLFMGVQKARECLEICEMKACGSSFGYDAVDFDHDTKGTRHLRAVRLHEVSQVTFPANDVAPILGTKARPFYVASNYPSTVSPETKQWLRNLQAKGSQEIVRRHESRMRQVDAAIARVERYWR